jgi:hypothetical protein
MVLGALKWRGFFHNIDCSVEDRKTPAEHFIVDFDFKEVIGDTYDAVVSHLQGFKFKRKEGGAPPGHHINYGNVNCNYDDRSYEHLPSKHCNMLAKDMHMMAMVRAFFLLVACRNLAAGEAAYEIFDMETMESVCFQNKVLHCPVKKNPDAHLHLFELSLLFGGHCMMVADDQKSVDQICHCDIDGLQEPETIKLFNNIQMPGSFIVPLEDHRTMHHSTPQNQIPVKRGQLLWFDGTMAHGGTTHKATQEGNDWHPALHCHLDSNKFPRVKGSFQHKQAKHVYFPDEHLQFETNLGEPLLSAEQTLGLLVEQIYTGSASASGGKECLKQLTQEQKKCHNLTLCAPWQPIKTVELETDPEQLHNKLLHNAVLRLEQVSLVACSRSVLQ